MPVMQPGANSLGSLSPGAASNEVIQWQTKVNAAIAARPTLAGGLPSAGVGQQVFTGNNVFTGGGPEIDILGFSPPSVQINRTAPQHGQGISSALLVYEEVPRSSQSFEWAQLVKLNTSADVGDQVGIYSQVYKHGQAEAWGITIEAQDFTVGGTSALVGMELGISYGGVDTGIGPTFDGVKEGLYLVYSDVAPNGGNPVGPVISVGDMIWCGPGAGISRFHALTFIKLHGCYTRACIDMTNVHDSPYSVAMAGGSAMFFSSGTGGFATPTWYPGAFVPTYNGAIRISVDGSDQWIPVCSNHP